MQHKILLVIGLCIVALVGYASGSQADGRKLTQTSGLAGGNQKTVHYRKRATRVRGYYAMRGGYSYGASDITGSYRSWYPSLGIGAQSPAGPFDSGFFFDSGIRPLNNAPYPH